MCLADCIVGLKVRMNTPYALPNIFITDVPYNSTFVKKQNITLSKSLRYFIMYLFWFIAHTRFEDIIANKKCAIAPTTTVCYICVSTYVRFTPFAIIHLR